MDEDPSWCEPSGYKSRPVAVIGAGMLGRRIATCWACAGYNVHVWDPNPNQCSETVKYFRENISIYQQYISTTPGEVSQTVDLEAAASDAWLAVECAPENLEIKQDVFSDLEAVCQVDCILATNSSSYKSSAVSQKTRPETRNRVLNSHYFMPPHVRIVELMTSGSTDTAIFPFLKSRMREVGLSVYVAKKESTGFIHNRVWAAIKRELLMVVAEGVADPKTADDIFFEAIVKPGTRPFVAMDLVGLDTVASIERNFALERGLPTSQTVEFLEQEYINKGKLGVSSENGGFYRTGSRSNGPRLLVLDNGLSGEVTTLQMGKLMEYTSTGQHVRTIFDKQYIPDGLVVHKELNRMFWTCMGYPGQLDGTICSANLDGSDFRSLLEKGAINTPKQMTIDQEAGKLYFGDREGLGIWRCDLDGSRLEKIIQTGDYSDENDRKDQRNWCVGVAISKCLGKIFWTQKGPPKGFQGRIFSANLAIPPGETAENRSDKVCLLEGLAEPINVEFHEGLRALYWTDRGEVPWGNTLNRVFLGENGQCLATNLTPLLKHQILARKFHEAIGMAIDEENEHVYVADLGGSICRCNLDGSDKTRILFEEQRAFTGITLF